MKLPYPPVTLNIGTSSNNSGAALDAPIALLTAVAVW